MPNKRKKDLFSSIFTGNPLPEKVKPPPPMLNTPDDPPQPSAGSPSSSPSSPIFPVTPTNSVNELFEDLEDLLQFPTSENTQPINTDSSTANVAATSASTVFTQVACAAEALFEPAVTGEASSYNTQLKGKLASMARMEGRRLCRYCLTQTRCSQGHKNCQSFFDRLVNLMLIYLDRECHFTVKLTPIYITEWLSLNTTLDSKTLDQIKLYLTEVFASFWQDFEQFFHSFFKH